MKLLRLFLAISLVAPLGVLSSTVTPPASADEVARKIMSGWMPYYSTAKSLASIETNTAYVKEVMPFWYTVKYDAATKKIRLLDLYTGFVGPKGAKATSIIETLTAMGKTVIPTITDGTSENVLAGLLATPTSRTQLVQLITTLTVDNKFSGIDLDFEGFAFVDKNTTWSKTAPSWVAFIKELSTSLHAKNKLLSVTTPYVWNPSEKQKGYYVYAWKDIASSIDRLRFMAYDYSVARPGPLGPISWTEKTLQYATSIMAPSKVYLGLPGYARGWITAVQGVCPKEVASAITVKAKKTEIPMSQVRDLRLTYGFVPTYNELFGEMTFTYDKVYNGMNTSGLATSCTATRTFWYHDQAALTLRASLVPKYKLGGVSMWTFGMEDENAFDGIKNVAKAYAQDVVYSTLSVDTPTVNYGTPVSLQATVTYKNGKPLANSPVDIERYSQTDDLWKKISSGVTDSNGQLVKQLLLGKKSSLRVKTPEAEFLTESKSNIVDISINRTLQLTAPTSIAVNSELSITGSVSPRNSGTYISLELLDNGTWKANGTPITTGALGDFKFTLPATRRGVLTYRIVVAADANFDQLISRTFSILIRGVTSSPVVK